MQSKIGGKVIKIAVGIAGLAAVFFLGIWISKQIYHRPDREVQAETDDTLPPPKAALTEEELEALFRSIKDPAALPGEAAMGILSGEGQAQASDEASGQSLENGQHPEDGSPAGVQGGNSEIDFPYLWTINEDIIAWITIPGTNIDYPILQHPTDDSFYLHHNIDGSYGYPACIYIEGLNSRDFTDPNTVIYGHNLKAKTMFTELHKFENRDFFEANDEIIIYLPDRTLHYQIFAAHVYDDRHLLYSFDFSDEEVYAGYLQSIYDIRDISANINRDFTVDSQDRIITLSTCMPNKERDAEKRLHVQAVLLEDE